MTFSLPVALLLLFNVKLVKFCIIFNTVLSPLIGSHIPSSGAPIITARTLKTLTYSRHTSGPVDGTAGAGIATRLGVHWDMHWAVSHELLWQAPTRASITYQLN